jgi:Trypsin
MHPRASVIALLMAWGFPVPLHPACAGTHGIVSISSNLSVRAIPGAARDPAVEVPTASTSREWPANARILAQAENADVSSTGNPSTTPLKYSGLLYDAKRKITCTAQFVAPQVILTAAHCVQDNQTGKWADPDDLYFLLQYQHGEQSDIYRPLCMARFDEWVPPRKENQTAAEKTDAFLNAYQWDYALIQVDHASITGHFRFAVDWKGNYTGATAIGYPGDILNAEIIQKSRGDVFFASAINSYARYPNLVVLWHGNPSLTEGTSGGAWVANFSRKDSTDSNIVIGVNSSVNTTKPGASFGPYFTGEFTELFNYVSKGCPK